MTAPITDAKVQAVFEGFPAVERQGLLKLRQMILDSPTQAPITEALRWGQPAYLCKTGSTLRLGLPKTGGFALYAHCQTTLIRDFVDMFPDDFTIEGNRAVHFHTLSDVQPEKLDFLISSALSYKLNKA